MQWYVSWYLLLPVVLSVAYGYTQCRSVAALGASTRRAKANRFAAALSGGALTLSWSVGGYPLPVFYVLAYLFRVARLVGRGNRKDWFLLNLSYINTMSLHLALIGGAALLQGLTMHALLADGFWRVMSAVAVLTIDIVEDLFFLRRPQMAVMLTTEAGSMEARPFMAFLWFCTGYLLVDSFLCVVELEPLYPPLFLMGSIAILMYLVIRFVLHISAIIRDEYLKDEHDRLSARLEETQKNAGNLKRMVDRDALTGAFSRRYIMERMDELIHAGAPFCLAFLDLDGLKRINDARGHDAGDHYLIEFTQAVEVRIREGDLLARVGGDEFVVLLPGCGEAAAKRRIGGIRSVLETRSRGGTVFRFSFGITAFLPGDEKDAKSLLSEADRAMYRDKEQRR